jgi:YD repeat-containing protein
VLCIFVFSLISNPAIVHATTFDATTVDAGPVTEIAYSGVVDLSADREPVYKLIVHNAKTRTVLELDPEDFSRIHKLQETSDGRTTTLRYIYDDPHRSVIVLFSNSAQDEPAHYTHYYRYALGERNSLELILEEGWVKENSLISSKFYDYLPASVEVRFYDKEGKLLKIESSDGSTRQFHYSRDGRLLTISSRDAYGQLTFDDQLGATQKAFEGPRSQASIKNIIYTVPSQDKEQRSAPSSFKNPDPDLSLDHSKEGSILISFRELFLDWLSTAHPHRAGPMPVQGGKVL